MRKGHKRALSPEDESFVRDAVAFRRSLSNKALMRQFRISCTTLWNIVRSYDYKAPKPGLGRINAELDREFEEFRAWRRLRLSENTNAVELDRTPPDSRTASRPAGALGADTARISRPSHTGLSDCCCLQCFYQRGEPGYWCTTGLKS